MCWKLQKKILEGLPRIPLELTVGNLRCKQIAFSNWQAICCKSYWFGNAITFRTMIYFSRDVKSLYLSFDTILDLTSWTETSQKLDSFSNRWKTVNKEPATTWLGQIDNDDGGICKNKKLCVPVKTTQGWRHASWINTRAQQFNLCPHLPTVTDQPVKIYIKEDATGSWRSQSTPITTTFSWRICRQNMMKGH